LRPYFQLKAVNVICQESILEHFFVLMAGVSWLCVKRWYVRLRIWLTEWPKKLKEVGSDDWNYFHGDSLHSRSSFQYLRRSNKRSCKTKMLKFFWYRLLIMTCWLWILA